MMTSPEQTYIKQETFRDSVSTIDEKGKRVWIYPKKTKGAYTFARTVIAYLLLGFFFSAPFIKIKGHPLILLNVPERKFVLFGTIFWPQDFHIFFLAMITFMVFVVLFTVVYGRVFCGWVCPQTVFMEMLFRKIEYFIEGDRNAQIALNKQPWTASKIRKKILKHILFITLSFIIISVFLSYIIGADSLYKEITSPTEKSIYFLPAFILFSLIFYFIYARFREQVCTVACPYGRLQGVLLDRNSVVVAYDYKRGEPRGKFYKREDRKSLGKGDCIDCKACVHACPTGIDIRNGLQMECIHCTACIDACNEIMHKISLSKGLIRYSSENNIATGTPFRITTRIAFYSAVLLILITTLTSLIVSRTDTETTILRTPGLLYQQTADGRVSNLYNVKVINKTNQNMSVCLRLLDQSGEIKMVGKEPLTVPAAGNAESAFFVVMDKKNLSKVKTKIQIGVYRENEKIETVHTIFMAPN
ncbi:MAG: cytochrome c oxidase accessory protein CcoG [Cytophagaceae bacterium]|nr:cytochrome c oxidase accessory protein CcoG [Cytophagaceae bacterium]MDW8456135.1 cytochrome c oxidase accessory protein CcoG [Cytophagaceae bacterium]